MARIFCMFTAGQARRGIEPAGPTYAEREILAALRAAAEKPENVNRRKRSKRRASES